MKAKREQSHTQARPVSVPVGELTAKQREFGRILAVSYEVSKRLRGLPRETVQDLSALLRMVAYPKMEAKDQQEVYATIEEILFPELIGGIRYRRPRRRKEKEHGLHPDPA